MSVSTVQKSTGIRIIIEFSTSYTHRYNWCTRIFFVQVRDQTKGNEWEPLLIWAPLQNPRPASLRQRVSLSNSKLGQQSRTLLLLHLRFPRYRPCCPASSIHAPKTSSIPPVYWLDKSRFLSHSLESEIIYIHLRTPWVDLCKG